jgi:hypothetical protein
VELKSPLDRTLERKLVAQVLFVVCLNFFDALATLRHLDAGAVELNPFMEQLLAAGDGRFVLVKHVLVSLGLFLLVLRYDRKLSRYALSGICAMFTCLAVYQTMLFGIG